MSRAEVVTAYRRMLELGLIQGTAGNVSARTARGMVITPSSVPPAEIDVTTLSEFDFGAGLVDDAVRPSSEWLLHLGVYRTSDAAAVVHAHSLAATAVSLIADELPAVHYYIAELGGPVPVVPYEIYGSEELARSVGNALQSRSAVILRNHGTVTTGATVTEALRRAELLEWIAELYLKAAAVGRPLVLSHADLDAVRAQAALIANRGYCCG